MLFDRAVAWLITNKVLFPVAAEQGAKATVMLWDTRRHRLASEDVLVLDRQVSPGVALKVDGLTARVVTN